MRRTLLGGSLAVVCTVGLAGLTACGTGGSGEESGEETTGMTSNSVNTGVVGTWVDPDGRGYLTFNEDGTLTGSDACNGIRSTWADGDGAGDGTVTVEPFPTTMMACTEGWSQWLLGVTTVEQDGDDLVVHGHEGERLGVLVPGDAPE